MDGDQANQDNMHDNEDTVPVDGGDTADSQVTDDTTNGEEPDLMGDDLPDDQKEDLQSSLSEENTDEEEDEDEL